MSTSEQNDDRKRQMSQNDARLMSPLVRKGYARLLYIALAVIIEWLALVHFGIIAGLAVLAFAALLLSVLYQRYNF